MTPARLNEIRQMIMYGHELPQSMVKELFNEVERLTRENEELASDLLTERIKNITGHD